MEKAGSMVRSPRAAKASLSSVVFCAAAGIAKLAARPAPAITAAERPIKVRLVNVTLESSSIEASHLFPTNFIDFLLA
jgi:hypothetical protein